jgi:hypothetical protein
MSALGQKRFLIPNSNRTLQLASVHQFRVILRNSAGLSEHEKSVDKPNQNRLGANCASGSAEKLPAITVSRGVDQGR